LKTDHIKGDYFWRTHSTALELISGLAPQDIIYASYYDRSDAIPYFIALDHDWKSVVISIRGTMTLESVVSDINCVPHELTEMGEECGFDGNGLFCHRGILHSVVWLYEDLKSHGKLAQAMKDYHSYRLRVVGHSLGAGVASILSVLLHPQYPNLRCLAFSPPGCTMSENLAEAVSEHTYSYIVDDDIIARMSIEGFEELRDSVLDMICRVKIPKYQVGRQAKKHDLLTAEGVSQSINETLYDAEKIKNSAFKEQVEEFWSFQAKLRDERNYVKLCLPGSIVHLFRTRINQSSIRMFDVGMLVGASEDHRKSDSEQNSEQSRRYTARWANRKDFEKIEISSHMLLDHSPIVVKNRIQAAAVEQFGLNENCLLEELEESERREMKSRFYAN
jgi:sn1-specific diacylglycerol lipase